MYSKVKDNYEYSFARLVLLQIEKQPNLSENKLLNIEDINITRVSQYAIQQEKISTIEDVLDSEHDYILYVEIDWAQDKIKDIVVSTYS